MERNGLSNFGRGSPKTDLPEEVVKSLFLFIAMAAILFNVGEWFDRILVEGHPRNIPVLLFQNP